MKAIKFSMLNVCIHSRASNFASDVKMWHLHNTRVLYWILSALFEKVKYYNQFWANFTASSQIVVDEVSSKCHNVHIFFILYKKQLCSFEIDELKV